MIWLISFGRFWYRFIVGDDWRLAVGVAVSVAVTALVAHSAAAAWWLMPASVPCILTISLRRAAKATTPAVSGHHLSGHGSK